MNHELTPEQEGALLASLLKDRNKAQFARDNKVPGGASMLSQHLSGHRPIGLKAAAAYAQGLGVPVEAFSPRLALQIRATGPTPPPSPNASETSAPEVSSSMKSEFVEVRRADVRFSNGHGQVVLAEDGMPPLVFRSDFLRRMGVAAGDAVVVEAEGVSNEPRIPDGAVVLVNRGDRERLNGELFAFRCDGELLIKRLERIDGVGILATADNPSFKPKQKIYQTATDFEVIGRAVWTGAVL
ncbi:S24 family peptidase [Acidovorax sp. SUPP2539]|uniref:S24 family peptidase n=1 Tax=Acidovorax sp. SUPP2539 TaxID=2920878 RepID=UPI0023DE4776|nr:S24 family peptidase [Acidovorax sp. SUPP2539]GKS91192.1 hypothetical protein AVTE2539_17525 [Acidovorax sp. SUPP2539]